MKTKTIEIPEPEIRVEAGKTIKKFIVLLIGVVVALMISIIVFS